jgi:hypothetical protein
LGIGIFIYAYLPRVKPAGLGLVTKRDIVSGLVLVNENIKISSRLTSSSSLYILKVDYLMFMSHVSGAPQLPIGVCQTKTLI